MTSRRLRIVAACLVQVLVAVGAVWPSLSARLTGEEILLEVAPVDPIDPFRGAYVVLTYPALEQPEDSRLEGQVFVPLEPVAGSELWQGRPAVAQRPSGGTYLACQSEGWQLSCGIESLFVPQDKALRLERQLATGAVARVRVDGRGNAAVVSVEPAD
jgi:uncharacterized membrane-anchored protein